jgi:predicted MFS family arabinose efflux permease
MSRSAVNEGPGLASEGTAVSDPTSAASGRRAVGALVALSVATFCYVAAEVLPTGMLTIISADLHRSRSEVGLLVTVYALVVLFASLPLARLTARIPRRRLLAATLGVFTLTTLLSAAAPNIGVLFGARLLTGLTQAVFWAVVTPTAAGLFPPQIRGRIVARLAIGTALAPVLGVPAGTWLAAQTSWRITFLALSAVGLATCAAVAVLLPAVQAAEASAAHGTAPDRRRFASLLAVTGLTITGATITNTYVAPFLVDVSGFQTAALGPLLSISGCGGVLGTLLVGRYLDAHPWGSLFVLSGLLSGAMLGLFAAGWLQASTVALLALFSMAFGALSAAIQHRALQVAPGSTDIASAATSSVFNLGIAAGSLAGAGLLATIGVRYTPLVGGLVATAALGVLLVEARIGGPPGPAVYEPRVTTLEKTCPAR